MTSEGVRDEVGRGFPPSGRVRMTRVRMTLPARAGRWALPAVWLLVLLPSSAAGQCVTPPRESPGDDQRSFWFRDLQFFRNPRADVRAPTIYAQLMPKADTVPSAGYSDDANPFLRQKGSWQAEAGFGADVPFWAWVKGDSPCTHGIDVFLHSSVHTLLRFADRDIVNSDFGFGGGLRFRGWGWAQRFSGRFRWKHESTHLGDEYTFEASSAGTLRRYNVSTEAVELFLAIDNAPEFREVDWYARAYAGALLHRGREGSF